MKKKRLICFLLVLAAIMSLAAVSFAAESREARAAAGNYSGIISYPNVGSARVVSLAGVSSSGSFSAWVKPSISTVTTIYWLAANTSDIVNSRGTNLLYTNTTTQKSLTYISGHGGSGIKYNLVAGSGVVEYDPYSVRGTWSPG